MDASNADTGQHTTTKSPLVTASYLTVAEHKNRTELLISIQGKEDPVFDFEGLELLIKKEEELLAQELGDEDASFANDSLERNMKHLPKSKYRQKRRAGRRKSVGQDGGSGAKLEDSTEQTDKKVPLRGFQQRRFSSHAA